MQYGMMIMVKKTVLNQDSPVITVTIEGTYFC